MALCWLRGRDVYSPCEFLLQCPKYCFRCRQWWAHPPYRLTWHIPTSFRQINLILDPNPYLWGDGAVQCVSGLWTGGGLCLASLDHGPRLARVCLCSGTGRCPKLLEVCSPHYSWAWVLPGNWRVRMLGAQLIVSKVETCHSHLAWTLRWYIFTKGLFLVSTHTL